MYRKYSLETLQVKVLRLLLLAASSTFGILLWVSAAVADVGEASSKEIRAIEGHTIEAVEVDEQLLAGEIGETTDVVDSTSAEDLEIPARYSASASTSAAGFDEIIGISAFVPIRQTPGDRVTFFEGSAQLNDGEPGFSLNVGHRDYDQDDDVINGGYVGVDSRNTDSTTFYQLAAGYERIQKDWELRFNGYLPVGDRTNTVQDIDIDTTVQTSSGFEGNQLVLSAIRDRQRVLQKENALGGLDLEVGKKIDDWYGGELLAYVSAYWLSGEESSLGGQARLAANFESNFNAGLAYQYDDLFGSSVSLSLSASLPGRRFQGEEERSFQADNEVAIRLRDPIVRRPNVAVNVVTERESFVQEDTAALRNPEEEEDYRFIHVALADGAGSGDGTVESPFGSVEDAIALIDSDSDTFSDGNTVVYVDGENASASIPGFTIPDRVRVLSQGPNQTIAGMAFPGFSNEATRLPFSTDQNFNVSSNAPNANGIAVMLPNSGDGVFPAIAGGANDLVTLGNGTVLAGFDIQSAANHGVRGDGVSDVELRNNRIENSGGSGIALNNVGGTAVLFDNIVNNSADRGILVQNSTTDSALEVAIAGFDLNNNRVGMAFETAASASEFPSQRVVVGPRTADNTSVGTVDDIELTDSILNSTEEGIIVEATGSTTTLASAATQEVSVLETTVEDSGAAGIRVVALNGAHSQEFNLDNSLVRGSGRSGIEVVNGEDPAGPTRTAAAQEIVIRESTIADNNGNGIDISLADASAQEVVIRGNQIVNNTGDGIRSIAQNVSVQEFRTDAENGDAGISDNTITGNGGQAIVVELEDVATIPIASIIDNDLSDNGAGSGLEFASTSLPGDSAAACLIIKDNLAPMGIQLTGADVLLTGGIPSIQIQDLPELLADSNITFRSVDFFGTTTESNEPFTNETNRCIP